jgi:hypothetical protein
MSGLSEIYCPQKLSARCEAKPAVTADFLASADSDRPKNGQLSRKQERCEVRSVFLPFGRTDVPETHQGQARR